MTEIQLRIAELSIKLTELEKRPKRFRQSRHDNDISEIEGEIKGLRWCMNHCFNVSTPNLIEQ